jgi:hypothetical protein
MKFEQVNKYKIVTEIRRGSPVPLNAKYLRSERKVVYYEDSGHDMLPDTPIWAMFDIYEVVSDN